MMQPSAEALEAAAHQLQAGSAEPNDWLVGFQASPAAWSLCREVLASPASTQPAAWLAATVLANKLRRPDDLDPGTAGRSRDWHASWLPRPLHIPLLPGGAHPPIGARYQKYLPAMSPAAPEHRNGG